MIEPLKLRARNFMNNEPGWWKSHYPVEQPSRVWQRMKYKLTSTDDWGQYELWENEFYFCSVRRFPKGFFVRNSKYMVLGISNDDESAQHDWRDFQRIKNDICGKEWEAIELYPAESRLVDPSNRFYLWCVPNGVLKFGLPKASRNVLTSDRAVAPQRPFPEEKP